MRQLFLGLEYWKKSRPRTLGAIHLYERKIFTKHEIIFDICQSSCKFQNFRPFIKKCTTQRNLQQNFFIDYINIDQTIVKLSYHRSISKS